LQDSAGNIIATTTAQAQSDWMTQDFVPFEAFLEFVPPATASRFLILKMIIPQDYPKKQKV